MLEVLITKINEAIDKNFDYYINSSMRHKIKDINEPGSSRV